jgi:site-specific DNA recombinase
MEVIGMKNVVAYCRVSTDAQAGEDRFGLDAQKQQIMDYCAANDMQISGWYVDEGESGVKENRPEFDRLLFGDIQNPPVEAVVVYKSDRVARSIKLYYYYMMLLEKKGMALISATEPVVNDETGLGGVYKSLMLFVAEQERENITKRTSSGRRVKAARGGYSGGRAPYGYAVKDKALVVVPEQAETVRMIFEMRDRHETLQDITDALNGAGRTTRAGKRFALSTVQTIVDNRPVYCGMYRYGGGEWVKGQHEAILRGASEGE